MQWNIENIITIEYLEINQISTLNFGLTRISR